MNYKLYFYFYKSTLTINLLLAFLIGILTLSFKVAALIIISFGFSAAISYKEIYKKNEYYFYYNKGITKEKLITFCTLLNILTALLLIFFDLWL